MPKVSTLCMVNAALNAASAVLEFIKEDRNNIRVTMYAITTATWLTTALLQLRWERQEALEAAEDEDGKDEALERVEA